MCLGFALGGCSIPIGSLFEKTKRDDIEMTGAINPVANAMAAMQSDTAGLPEADLAYARAAAAEVLARGGKDVSQNWENPATGARGAVTPLTASYTENGNTCREFLLSHVQGKSEVWLQGNACKFASDKWEVRSLRAWKRS
jgi:surface antigen